jgi:hypothetical protein
MTEPRAKKIPPRTQLRGRRVDPSAWRELPISGTEDRIRSPHARGQSSPTESTSDTARAQAEPDDPEAGFLREAATCQVRGSSPSMEYSNVAAITIPCSGEAGAPERAKGGPAPGTEARHRLASPERPESVIPGRQSERGWRRSWRTREGEGRSGPGDGGQAPPGQPGATGICDSGPAIRTGVAAKLAHPRGRRAVRPWGRRPGTAWPARSDRNL